MTRRKLTQPEYIARGMAIFNGEITYEKLVYVNRRGLVTLTCGVHGDYRQIAGSHLLGKGCDKCGGTATLTTREWVDRAEIKRDAGFDYSRVVYVSKSTKVLIGCHNKEHNFFLQTPDNHMAGQGCPLCKSCGYSAKKPGSVYVMSCGDKVKLGITNKTAKSRARQIYNESGQHFEVAFEVKFKDGYVPLEVETLLLRELRKEFIVDPTNYAGHTEVFLGTSCVEVIERVISKCGEVFAVKKSIQ